MEVWQSPLLISKKGQQADKLARALLKLKASLSKSQATCKQDKKERDHVDDEDLGCLQKHIDVLCGGSFKLSWSTEPKLRHLHSLGLIPDQSDLLEALCRKHLRSKDCSSPWQLLLHFDWLNHKEKYRSLFAYLLKNFVGCSEDDHYLLLSLNVLARFLASPDLVLDREVDAARSLLRWLNHAPGQRVGDVNELLSYVHIERLNREELVEIESVFRFLAVPLSLTQTFNRRFLRFRDLAATLDIRVFLALTRGHYLELSELNVVQRRWETRISLRVPSFQTEALTGTSRNLIIVGDEDFAFAFKDGKSKAEVINLCPEFLGPMAYRFVTGQLYAAQNQGWRLKIWTRVGQEWTCLSTRVAPSWLYRIQLFANEEYLLLSGMRDKAVGNACSEDGARTAISNPSSAKEPFLWSYNVKSETYKVAPKFSGPAGSVQYLGPTENAFWVLHDKTQRIWMTDLDKNSWQETKLYFPANDKVLSSCCCGSNLLVLSCNTVRGNFIRLSTLARMPEPRFGVIGTVQFDFPKTYVQDFLCSARFHVLSDSLFCF